MFEFAALAAVARGREAFGFRHPADVEPVDEPTPAAAAGVFR